MQGEKDQNVILENHSFVVVAGVGGFVSTQVKNAVVNDELYCFSQETVLEERLKCSICE